MKIATSNWLLGNCKFAKVISAHKLARLIIAAFKFDPVVEDLIKNLIVHNTIGDISKITKSDSSRLGQKIWQELKERKFKLPDRDVFNSELERILLDFKPANDLNKRKDNLSRRKVFEAKAHLANLIFAAVKKALVITKTANSDAEYRVPSGLSENIAKQVFEAIKKFRKSFPEEEFTMADVSGHVKKAIENSSYVKSLLDNPKLSLNKEELIKDVIEELTLRESNRRKLIELINV